MANRHRRQERAATREAEQLQFQQLFKQRKRPHLYHLRNRQYLRSIRYYDHKIPREWRHPDLLQLCQLLRRFIRTAGVDQYWPLYPSPYELADELLAQPKLRSLLLQKQDVFLFWLCRGKIVRSVRSWRPPRTQNPHLVIKSFIRHTYVRYPHQIPAILFRFHQRFIDYPNWRKDAHYNFHFEMLLHLSQGKGVHTYPKASSFPVPSKANTFLLRAPRRLYSFQDVLRWACLRSHGLCPRIIQQLWPFLMRHPDFYLRWGTEVLRFIRQHHFANDRDLIRTIFLGSELLATLEDAFPEELPEYYQSVIRFFLRYQAEIECTEWVPWMRYLIHQREEAKRPLRMKGRTPRAFRRLVTHYLEGQQAIAQSGELPRSTIGPFQKEVKAVTYEIVQLKSDFELYLEGYYMSNCVQQYAADCREGQSSIWSLRRLSETGAWVSEVTIEVERDQAIVQALMRFNRRLCPKSAQLVRDWAAQESLDCRW